MGLSNWLLGRDTPDLRIVRILRTIFWWVAWANLALSLVIVYAALAFRPDPNFTQPVVPWPTLSYILGAATPFVGWAVLSALLAIHDLFAPDGVDMEMDEDDDDVEALDGADSDE